MGRRLKTLRLSVCRPSSTCEETREFSQTCSEAELPTGDLRPDEESLVKEFVSGTRALLEQERQWRVRENFVNMKLRKTHSVLEEASSAAKR